MPIKNNLLLAGLLFLFISQIAAQSKELSLEAAILQQRTSLAPENIDQLSWVKGKDAISFVEKVEQEEVLRLRTVEEASASTLLSLSELNKAMEGEGKKALKAFPRVEWLSASEILFTGNGAYFIYDTERKGLISLENPTEEAAHFDLHTKQKHLAFTSGNNLMVKPFGKEVVQLTNDTNEAIVNGQAVHRYEFGIRKGTFWSPDGAQLAFYRNDQSEVSDYPLVDITTHPASLKNIKYPMAGMPSEKVQLGIYKLATGNTLFLETNAEFEYLTNVAWGPSGKFIYIAALNRDQNHMRLDQYDAETGKWDATLFEERQERYVEPLHPMEFLNNEKGDFVWLSKRDGFMHVYHYAKTGKLIKQLTKGNWVVKNIVGFNPERTVMYVEGTGEDATQTHVYRVDIKTAKVEQLTDRPGTHHAQLSSSGKYLVQEFTSVDVPREIVMTDAGGKVLHKLLKAANPLADYQWKKAELFTLSGDVPLQCRLIKPSHFDATKKYPVVVYVYNGPHVQLITNRWMAGAPLWMHYLAEQGYLVFTVDGRGSANRGVDFEQAVFRQLGKLEMEDQLKGVSYLKSLPYVDQERMAVHGWSFGGFMTSSLMLHHPGVFKVGVAGGPVIDWKFYEVMYTERYMDTPEQNPEGFESTSLLGKVGNLNGKLLMIHGLMDDVVVPQHNLAFVRKCVEEEVQVDFFPYPTHPHNVRGKDRVHLMRKVIDYIQNGLNN
jgi:dipeptidyl-peptidase-4